jgi:transposase InsO family protein
MPRARRELAEWAQQAHQFSQRRVAGLIPVHRATLRYQHHRDPQEALRVRLRELAGSRVRYGYRRLTVMLRREGWEVNAKRIYRLYTEEGLIVRTQKRRERASRCSHCQKQEGGARRDHRIVGADWENRLHITRVIPNTSPHEQPLCLQFVENRTHL